MSFSIYQLRFELSKTRQEKERLHQNVSSLEDEVRQHRKEKVLFLNEIQELTETVHKL